MSSSGQRVRKFFSVEPDAKKFGASLRKKYAEGRRGGIIPHELAVMASAADELLIPHGVTILEAARAYVRSLEDHSSPETLREKYARALAEGEQHWSAIYARDMNKLENWLGKELMDERVARIQLPMIDSALRAHGAKAQSTLDHRRRYVMAIVNFKPRHRKQGGVSIMSIAQAAAMVRSARHSPAERWAGGLLLWAGIRPDAEDGEITRMDWSAVGESEIYISREVSKTKTDRHIPITPRLRRLLDGHPAEGPVIPPNWRRVYRRLRRAAGLTMEQDITRHTFASNHLVAFGEDATKRAMGHTANSSTLFRHYRASVPVEAGVKYFR